jgi:hypothetical protein
MAKHEGACPIATAKFIRSQAEKLKVSVNKFIGEYAKEAEIPVGTLKNWVWPEHVERKKAKARERAAGSKNATTTPTEVSTLPTGAAPASTPGGEGNRIEFEGGKAQVVPPAAAQLTETPVDVLDEIIDEVKGPSEEEIVAYWVKFDQHLEEVIKNVSTNMPLYVPEAVRSRIISNIDILGSLAADWRKGENQ